MNLKKVISFIFVHVLFLCLLFFSDHHTALAQQNQIATNAIVQDVVKNALKKLGDPNVEIVAQGSWISGINYKNPLYEEVIEKASDHDMRVYMRSRATNKAEEALIEKQADNAWKSIRKNVEEELAKLVESGKITPKDIDKIKRSINIYPPEELMKGVTSAEDALNRFKKLGAVPNLSEVGKAGAGGSYGNLLKFERQAFEKGARGTAFYLDGKQVRTGGVDLNHMLEGHGLYTPEAIAKAAQENLDNALHSLRNKNLKDTKKYVERAAERMQWARGKLKIKPSANDMALDELNKQLQNLWEKFQAAETRTDSAGKIIPKTGADLKVQQDVLEEFSKLSAKLETVLKDAADDSCIMQSLSNAITQSAPRVSMFFRSLLENSGPKWSKVTTDIKQGMKKIGDYVAGETATITKAARQIGFLNALGAYWAIKDLPEAYANKGPAEAASRFSLSLASLALPEAALVELTTALATGIAELAVDYASSYGYKLVTGTQDCFDLIEGMYTVKGRETQALGEGIKKCHNVKINQLACDAYDTNYLGDSMKTLQEKGFSTKIDPKRIPSEITSLIACHAENASRRFDEPTKTDKGVEDTLISKCTNAIITAWLEQRDMVIEEINTLASEIERRDLRVSFNSNETIIMDGEKKATVNTYADIIPAADKVMDMLKAKIQCIGGKGSSPFVYKRIEWKREGVKAGTTGSTSEFIFNKKGKETICASAEIEYGVFNTASTLPPKGSSGKINKSNCVDVEITEELKTEKITAEITGDTKARAPLKGETGRNISLVANVKTKRSLKDFSFVWTHEGGFAGDAPLEDHLRTIRYDKPGTYDIKVEIFDLYGLPKDGDTKKPKIAEAKHTINIEPSLKEAKIELKMTAPAYIILEDSVHLAVEVIADDRIKTKLKPPVWYVQRGEIVALAPTEKDILAARQGIGQGNEIKYTPRTAQGYTFYVDVFGEGSDRPVAQSSKKVAVRGKVLQTAGAWQNILYELPDAHTDPPLDVIIMADRTNVASGERINVHAVGQGGKTPYQYTWVGTVEGQGRSVVFVPGKTNRELSVEIKDAKGQTVKQSISFTVDKLLIPMEGLKDKAVFGTWTNARAIAGENTYVFWQSIPAITFKPQESNEGRTSILFDRMGKVRVWAEARVKRDASYETLGETEQIQVMVTPPDVRIEVDPPIQVIGGIVTAEVKFSQAPEHGSLKYVWIDPPQPMREQMGDAKIRFTVRDSKPIPIEVELRGNRGDDVIVNLKRPYDPDGKPTTTEVTAGGDSKAATKKKEGAAKLTGAKEAVAAGKLGEGIAMAEEAAAIDPSNTEAPLYAAKIKSDQTFITEKLKSFTVFMDQENFPEAEKVLGDVKKLHPLYQPVTEADILFKTKKAAYEKKIRDSNEKLEQAKLDVRKGKLDEGIRKAHEAFDINKNNQEALQFARRSENNRQDILTQLGKVKTLISESNFNDAREQLTVAKNINPLYQPVLDVEALLNGEASKYKGFVQQRLNEVNSAIDKKEFKKALDLTRNIRASITLYGLDNENLTRWENWALKHETEKEEMRRQLKSAEEKLKNYDYDGAIKGFEGGFQNFNNLWAASDPEPPYYGKLREEAFSKNKRLGELISALYYGAEQTPVPPVDVLERALKAGEEATALQPGNTTIKGYIQTISARLKKIKDNTEQIKMGRAYLDEGRKAENAYLFQMASLQANPGQKGSQLEESANASLAKAIKSYTASLSYTPDKNLEKHIKELKSKHTAKINNIDNIRLAKKLRSEADELVKKSNKPSNFEEGIRAIDEAVNKYQQSLKLYAFPDAEALAKTIFNLQVTKHTRLVQKYRSEAEALENAGKILDALAKYELAASSYHSTAPWPERMHIQNKIGELKGRITNAKNWRAQGEVQQKQGKLAEALASYKQSVKLLSDPSLDPTIKALEEHLAREKSKKGAADRLWAEGGNLYRQGKETDALAKLKESLTYWSNQERVKYVQDLESNIARKKTLCKNLWDEGNKLQNANRFSDALLKFKEYQKNCPTTEMATHIQKLEAKIRSEQEKESRRLAALKLRQEADTFIRQNMLREAINKYRQSLSYWPDAELEKYVQALESRLATMTTTAQTNTGRSYTSKELHSTTPSVSQPSPISLAELTSLNWQFGRQDGSAIGTIRLAADGTIRGYSHPNESRWIFNGKELIFYHADGRPATNFSSFRKEKGKWVISGPFLLGGNTVHVLREL